ncbi:DNase I-like protein, partial [Polyporus arcularius HHB13444]
MANETTTSIPAPNPTPLTDNHHGHGTTRGGAPGEAAFCAAQGNLEDGSATTGGRVDGRELHELHENELPPPEGQGPPAEERSRPKKKRKTSTRAKVKLATLNMRGYGPSTMGGPVSDKWMLISQVIREQRIAVLAIQETHLSATRLDALNALFGATLRIFSSPDPLHDGGARGVAFVINKKLVDEPGVVVEHDVAGRMLSIAVPRPGGETLRVANVYAPNRPADNARFWEELDQVWTTARSRRPDVILGDFNIVEDPIDRIPAHLDDRTAVTALRAMRSKLGLVDGWRMENGNTKAFTYLQTATGAQSRLDRVYMAERLMPRTVDWELLEPGIHTDHKLAMCSITNARTPYKGKGRWRIPQGILMDKEFLDRVREMGLELQDALAGDEVATQRPVGSGPQRRWEEFKREVVAVAKRRAKKQMPKLARTLAALREDLDTTLNQQAERGNREVDLVTHAAILQDRIAAVEIKRFGLARRTVAARDWLEGETIGRYWSRMNAPPRP